QAVELLQVLDPAEGPFAERRLSVEGMQNDPFQQIAQGDVVVLGKSFEHLEDTFFHPYSGLYANGNHTTGRGAAKGSTSSFHSASLRLGRQISLRAEEVAIPIRGGSD